MHHATLFFVSRGTTILADGGVAFTSHIIRALLLDTSCDIIGRIFAGRNMAPSKYIYEDGIRLKRIWKKGLGPTVISYESAWLDSKYWAHTGQMQ